MITLLSFLSESAVVRRTYLNSYFSIFQYLLVLVAYAIHDLSLVNKLSDSKANGPLQLVNRDYSMNANNLFVNLQCNKLSCISCKAVELLSPVTIQIHIHVNTAHTYMYVRNTTETR